jgi:DNA-directed RNA polymerase sigma subunit (sigma70/sigma32)
MALDAPARGRLEQILQDSNSRRRALVVASLDLRQRLAAAIRNPATEDAQFQRLLAEATALRTQEHELWQRDQAEIGRTLTPRQQAIFALRWIRFQERIQQMIEMREGRGGPPRDSGF